MKHRTITERPHYGKVCRRGHVVPASTYREVLRDQEMEYERDGIKRPPFDARPKRPVLMRGALSRLIWKHSLSPGCDHFLGFGKHVANGYSLEVFSRWVRRKRLTAFSWQAFEKHTGLALDRLRLKYRLDHHFDDHIRQDFSVRRATIRIADHFYADGLVVWLNGVRQCVRLADLAMAGGLEDALDEPLRERHTELANKIQTLEQQKMWRLAELRSIEHRLDEKYRLLNAAIAELRTLRRQIAYRSSRLVSPQERKLLRAIFELNIVSKGDLDELVRKQQRIDREERYARKAARSVDRVPA